MALSLAVELVSESCWCHDKAFFCEDEVNIKLFYLMQ